MWHHLKMFAVHQGTHISSSPAPTSTIPNPIKRASSTAIHSAQLISATSPWISPSKNSRYHGDGFGMDLTETAGLGQLSYEARSDRCLDACPRSRHPRTDAVCVLTEHTGRLADSFATQPCFCRMAANYGRVSCRYSLGRDRIYLGLALVEKCVASPATALVSPKAKCSFAQAATALSVKPGTGVSRIRSGRFSVVSEVATTKATLFSDIRSTFAPVTSPPTVG